MAARLSIRSYSFVSHTHSHPYHQLVLPLVGSVDIDTGRHRGRASPGQCIITLAGDEHFFAPEKGSRFLVADLDQLPPNLQSLAQSFVRVSEPMQAFCYFARQQLEHRVNPELEQQMGTWFTRLLAEEDFQTAIDPRLNRVLDHLQQNLQHHNSLAEQADIACLSLSQFKALFKKELGQTPGQYLLGLRMEKARALLVHTDYAIGLIAEQVGYQDLSAFSHRFTRHFGHAPIKLRSR